jgi:fructose-bisphosphate aldolase class 1
VAWWVAPLRARRDLRTPILRAASEEHPAPTHRPQILFEETLFQNGSDGQPLVKQLTDRGIVPGIKADVGVAPLPGSPMETFTMVGRALPAAAARAPGGANAPGQGHHHC